MTQRLLLNELQQVRADPARMSEFRNAAAQMGSLLRPSFRQFEESDGGARFQNIVGSFGLAGGDVVEVTPKVGGEGWTRAVIDLLTDQTRLAVTGSQHSRPSNRKDDLTAAIALEYSRRLERALRREGPMVVYERRHETTRRWRGRLSVASWARTVALDPTRFPMSQDELSTRNDFTRAMSVVAGMLSRSASGETVSRLRRLQGAIIPGSPVPDFVDRSVARRRLPAQWASYTPAWDIASAILRSQSVVGGPGWTAGLEVAVEPWRLLETCLERALTELAAGDDAYVAQPKHQHVLLTAEFTDRPPAHCQSVEPDGMLRRRNGAVAATFEAKYATAMDRTHAFQALTTAAAVLSPIAILVFPWAQETRRFTVTGFRGSPRTLATIGVDLFAYRRGESDRELATRFKELVSPMPGE